MEYRKIQYDRFALKVSVGEKIRESIETLVQENNIHFAKIEGIGALKDVTLGVLRQDGTYKKKTFNEDLELISIKGSVAGQQEIHMHTALGREDFTMIGGHFFEGVVTGVAEILISVLSEETIRKEQHGMDKFPTWQLG